ncbi:MAG: conserved repeat domain, partial [Planctomycetaceae bacterium]|nr:conserved repeat domain [Planctomycetaceae bacterium]
GSSSDYANSVAVDASGRTYIGGSTASLDLPTTSNAFQPTSLGGPYSGSSNDTLGDEGFAAAFNAQGSAFDYLTYIGGTSADGLTAVAVDAAGNASYVGFTGSTDLLTRNPAQARRLGLDGLIIRLLSQDAGHITLHNSPFTAVEGNQFNGLVAFFDTTGSETADQFSAMIDWGDGQLSAGTIVGDFRNGFQILGSHLYPDVGSHDIFVTLRDSLGQIVTVTSTTQGTAVADGRVRYHVSIDTTALTGTQGQLSLQFNPSVIPGSPDAEAKITGLSLVGGTTGSSTLIGDVSQASSNQLILRPSTPLNRYVENLTLGSRIEFDLEFVGAGLSQPHLSDFADVFALQLLSANGLVPLLSSDASASTLCINLDSDGTTHAQTSGTAVTIAAGGRATVANAPLTLTIAPFTIKEGLQFNLPVATLTNGNPLESADEFTAQINWGDGSPVSNGVISGSNGQFMVSGSHAYQTIGSYAIVVSATDPDGLTVTSNTGRAVLAATTFQNDWGSTNYPPDSVPVSGDFNGDGILDVAIGGFSPVPTNSSRGVAILLGRGDGSFALAGFQPTGQSAVQLAVADFNNDGKLDVAAAISPAFSGQTTVELLLGNGDGTLQSSVPLSDLKNPRTIIAADLNHDGKTDLLYTDVNTSALQVALGHGDGTFTVPAATPIPGGSNTIYVADMNRDSVPDVVLTSSNASGATLYLLVGLGDGTFGTPTTVASGLQFQPSLAIADFNGDGKPDIASVDNSALLLFSGNGDGTFAPPQQIAAVSGLFVVAGDFNGDGRPDLATNEAVPQYNLSRVRVFLNNGNGGFDPGASYEGIAHQTSLATADFDHDGHLDIAVSGSFADISVMPGIGDGTFASSVQYLVAPSVPGTLGTPEGVATADINGDGHSDAVLVLSDGRIVTELGDGAKNFQSVVSGNVGSRFEPVLADVNHDGHLDVIAASQDSGIAIVLGKGDGTFPTNQINNPTGDAGAMVLADFNHDGRLDMAAVNANIFGSRVVNVSLANADGTFRPASSYPTGALSGSELSIATGDFNGDSSPDLLFANSDGTLTILLGNADGTFAAPLVTVLGTYPFNTGFQPQSARVGDFDGDGKLDVIAVGFDSTGVFLPGHGDGTLGTPKPFTTNFSSRDVAVGDLNGDGKLDLVTAEESGAHFSPREGVGGVTVLFGNGDGTFQAPIDYFAGANPKSVALGDFNQDGRLDIATANFISDTTNSSGNVSILLGSANGTFQPAANFTTIGNHPIGIAVGDLNADGKLDIAVLNQSNDAAILLGKGDGTFQNSVNYLANSATFAGFGAIAIGDLNGDGKADLAAANTLLIGKGDGTFPDQQLYTYLPPILNTSFQTSNPQDISAGDLDGDGNIDLAVSMRGTTAILFGNGNGSFRPPVLLTPGIATGLGSYSNRVRLADVDGDGDLDVITLNQNLQQGGGAVAVWRNDGSGQFSLPVIRNVPMPDYDQFGVGIDMEIGDLNGDGRVDVVVTDVGDEKGFMATSDLNAISGGVSVLIGAGDGTFAQPVHYLLPPRQRAYQVTLADLNRDGRPEIVALTSPFGFFQQRSAVALFANNGDGTFSVPQILDAGVYQAGYLAAADFNSDGAADILVPDSNNDSGTFGVIYAGQGPILVTDAPVTVTGTNLNPVPGLNFSAIVATFKDANPYSAANDFIATINWGDGQSSPGTIAVDPLGGFDVLGTHTYSSVGVFTTVVTVNETGQATHVGNGTVRVDNMAPALNAGSLSFDAMASRPFAGIVSTFTDADSNGSVGDFSASIDWGDGVTSTGSIASAVGGGFSVSGAHTYANPGAFSVRVDIADIDGETLSVNGSVQVAPRSNQAPVALNDSYFVNEDTTLTVLPLQGVLANDTDVDADTLDALVVSAPTHGSLNLNPDGSFTYIPAANFHGSDSFSYRANDGTANSSVATVNIVVKSVNDPAIANNDLASTNEDTPVVINVLANDTNGDGAINPATLALTSLPLHGTVKANPTTGAITYTPFANFFGSDNLHYRVLDSNGVLSNEATVTITVNAVNDAPVAINDVYVTNEDTQVSIAAAQGTLANDTDIEGTALTASIVTLPSHGTLTFNSDGSLTYVPAPNFAGSDTFTYRASDGNSPSGIASVSLLVLPLNDAPVISPLADGAINEGNSFASSG